MTEIKKLYSLAGVEKKQKHCCDWDSFCPYPYSKCDDKCPYWEIERVDYPPFTAEKQISIIKWLADTDNYIKEICRMIDTRKYCIETVCENISMANNFEEALAGLINKLWQDLTEAEQNEIREILQ